MRELIDQMSESRPESPFLITPESDQRLTFRGLKEKSISLSAWFQHIGLEPCDKIAFLLDNSLFTARLFLGAMYGGFVAVPLNVRAGVLQLSYMLDHCDAKVVFAEDQYSELIKEAMGGVERDIRVISTNRKEEMIACQPFAAGNPPDAVNPHDVALLMYSSGSTGQPKAAVHTHRSLLCCSRNVARVHQLSPADRSLLVLPLYHMNGGAVTLIPTLLSGGSVVVPSQFSVSHFWKWMDQHDCSWSALVPTIISQLVNWEETPARLHDLMSRRIRFFRSSSAPLSPSLHRQFLDKFKLPLLQAMGSTEAGNVFSNPLPPGENKIGSPGLPTGFEIKIADQDGHEVAPGESGEVLIRGDGLMRGYYKDTEGTAAVLDGDGWFRTGDLAYQDRDGYFFVVGRSKELIIKGGVNIAPRQIDEVVESHPAVLEAAAVGVPDRHLGEDLVVFVVLRAGVDCNEEGLLSFCESRLGHFKTPSRILFVKELPKGPSGKVQRLRLLEKATEAAASPSSHPGTEVAGEAESGTTAGKLIAPASVEQAIREIWAELLPGRVIGTESNFFALGGSSLLAMQCVSKLRTKLPVPLSVSDFFENGTIAQQVALVEQRLTTNSQANGEFPERHAADDGGQDIQSPIPSLVHCPLCPLSPAQQRLWFLEQLNPGNPIYNESEAVRLRGELHVQELRRALDLICARHEALRTTFQIDNDQPAMHVHQQWPMRLKMVDLSVLQPQEREAEVERLLIDEPRIPFRLDAEPGIRTTLIRLASDEHVLIVMLHHIICDRASVGILWREMAAFYSAFSRGNTLDLPPLPIHYRDYIVSQQQQTIEAKSQEDISFWAENLRGAPELLPLPADRPRPPVLSYRGTKRRFRLHPRLTKALRDSSQLEETSLFILLTAALNTLLYRYTGSEDILLGIPIADRERPELQSMVGFLVHTHVLRTRLSRDMTFRDLLAHVRKSVLEAYRHRAVSFDQVVHTVRPTRNRSYSPLFQVMINWRDRNLQPSFIGLEGLQVESLLAESRTSKFDLTLFLTDAGDEIRLELEYSTDLFDEERIARMVDHYETLLEAVVADPDRRLADLPLLTASECQQTLIEWNQTQLDWQDRLCVHELVEAQVKRSPDAVAVVFENTRLTYSELNDRSSRLAIHLKNLGVGPNVLVGICVARSLEMVVGLLGILKAGGAYLPLDPAHPTDRLAYILGDAQPPVLVTSWGLQKSLPPHHSHVVDLDAFSDNQGSAEDSTPDRKAGPNDLAYVLYTSGSTGKPKGVQIPHRAVANFLQSMQREPGLLAEDTLLAVTTLSFDIAGLELFLPLVSGARVVIASSEVVRDGLQLSSLMNTCEATVMQATPATWRLLLEAEWKGNPALKILCGGEAWSSALASELLPRCKSLWNMYGPTETTIWSSVSRVEQGHPVSIGRPITNTTFYVLDGCGQPVPVGVPGELHIGGEGLADGYLNRPDQTKEKFVDDPFSNKPGARLYRTGDLVRYLPEGGIEFLRRIDHQVKIRGFRIELGEVEAVLTECPGVCDAVVIAREDTRGDKRLVAFYTGSEDSSQSKRGLKEAPLRAYLASKLPEYMVPSAFVKLESVPRTPNGKINREALPEAEIGVPASRGYEAPLDEMETTLAEIFRDVLKVQRVGRHDNFFDLGGHSLAALRLVSEIQKRTGKTLALAKLFQAATVGALAAILHKNEVQSWSSLVPINDRGSKPPLFLVHGAEGNLLLFRQLVEHLGPDQPVYGFQSNGLNGDRAYKDSIREIAADYIREILAAHQDDQPLCLGGYCMGGLIALEMARQLQASGKSIGLVLLLETYNLNSVPAITRRRRSLLHFAQRIYFHVTNAAMLPMKDRRKFFLEKLAIERARLGIRLNALAHQYQLGGKEKGSRGDAQLIVRKVNDRAASEYVAEPYGGRVALIRPKVYFTDLDSPTFGWDEVVGDGLEVHELEVYPRGMLIEPFCQMLAEKVKRCLAAAFNLRNQPVNQASRATVSADGVRVQPSLPPAVI